MACFPRFFHHRSKNKFTPAQDENSDTILNTQDSPVQIGLYIRREEKPLYSPIITPSASEAQLQRLRQQSTAHNPQSQQQQQQQQQQIVNENLTSTPSTVSNSDGLPDDSSLGIQQRKMFRSNKNRLLLQSEEREKDVGKDKAKAQEQEQEKETLPVNGCAINVTRSNSKLKPVKERRPTALPTEAPPADADEEDERTSADAVDGSQSKLKVNVNGIIDESGDSEASVPPTTFTPNAEAEAETNVKFFIGLTQELNADDDTLSCHSNDNNNNSNNCNKLANGTLPQSQPQVLGYEQQKMPAKSKSNMSLNYLSRSKSIIANETATANGGGGSHQKRRVSTMPDIMIPPPPPMPLELLKPATPLHLRKKTAVKDNATGPEATEATTETTEQSFSTSNSQASNACSPNCHQWLTLCEASVPPTTFTPNAEAEAETNVKFFIGLTQELNADDDTLSCHSNDNNNNSNNCNKLANGTLPQSQPQVLGYEQQKMPAKSKSNMSLNYLSRSKSIIANETATANGGGGSHQKRRVSTMPDIMIPPPPPMPLELLKPATPLHLRKKTADNLTKSELEQHYNSRSSQSSITKLQRVEGGLIYMRPNLPVQQNIEIEYIAKDEATRNLILNAIERNDFLNNLMDKERKEMVINAMAPASYKQNSYIIMEHDEGSEIFVSADGYYEVIQAGHKVGNFGPATVFGELAILYNAPRKATIKAASDARVWKIARETFRAIMQLSGSREREENLQFLRSAPFLQELEESLLGKVVDLLQRKFYETGSCIVREGELGNEFFIIRGGTVTIKKKDAAGVEQVVAKRKRGDYFGEQALMNADVRQASVYADAPGSEVLKLEREAFVSYLGTIRQLSEKPDVQSNGSERSSNKSAEFDNEHAHIAISDLKKVATLGSGAFGRVDLVAYNTQAFALKIIKKIEVIKQDQIEHVYNEKNVMIKCRASPFIAQLYRTYRNEKYVYFLMEACMGGDVWTVMTKRQYFDDKTAKFIAGCVVEAFDYLHAHNFIYRDLKPENLMLSSDGYCKLVDFGFAKYVRPNEKTNTFAGTPEYVAPEIILDRGHDRSVDYWGLGILIYELLVGQTPFRGVNQVKIYQKILGGIDLIAMPSRIPKSAQHLIRHLCKQLPAERLGYQRRGIADIKRHSWFDSLDWVQLKQKQLTSPIKRPLKSWKDLQYFMPLGVENDYEPPEELSGWDKDF
ncbi:CG4839 [Drosophila busckii]|uniref:cGMP-dependent protein kinase n=1 Tax=Drosophila busckii TaxID=30019 RepID=A0A0M3QTM6_DROBS|nr:CG4839 [Drosophila busckii]